MLVIQEVITYVSTAGKPGMMNDLVMTMVCKRGCRSGIKAQVLVNDWDGTLLCPQCGYEDYTETKETRAAAEVAAYTRRVPKYIREEWNV